jgi:hypothetical protein
MCTHRCLWSRRWSYSDIPSGFRELIDRGGRRADLKAVSLGPGREWFLRANNGCCWWGGWSSDSALSDDIENVEEVDGDVKFIDFGYDDAYIIRYN